MKALVACALVASVMVGASRPGHSMDSPPASSCNRGNPAEFAAADVSGLKKAKDDVNKGMRGEMAKHPASPTKGKAAPFGLGGYQGVYLEGRGLEGRHFSLATGQGAIWPPKPGMVLTDSANCESPAMQLSIDSCDRGTGERVSCRVKVTQGPDICDDLPNKSQRLRGVQIVKGFWNTEGNWTIDPKSVSLSCDAKAFEKGGQLPSADGAISRCIRYFRYDPGTDADGSNDKLSSCIRMLRADYCGDGVAHTFTGASITAHDRDHPGSAPECSNGQCFEATWSRRGAGCIGHSRWLGPDLDVDKTWCAAEFKPTGEGYRCRKRATFKTDPLYSRSAVNSRDQPPAKCGPDVTGPGCS
jgi:hypothetical protein